jgi:SsrA-binding protein
VSPTEKRGIKIAAQNRKAYHDYFVEDKYEAGIELFGTEVKSIRAGTVNLKEAWCAVEDGQLIVKQMHISPYEKGNIFNKDPMREKRLLMHKREIMYLYGKVRRDGYTIVPLSVYFKNSRVKVEVGLCKGKQLHDKRETAAKRDAEREMDRAKKSFNRY